MGTDFCACVDSSRVIFTRTFSAGSGDGKEVGGGGGGGREEANLRWSSIPSHLRRDKTLVFNRPGINSDAAEPCRSLNPQIIPLPTQSPPIETKSAENGD